MGENIVSSVKMAVFVRVTSKGLFGVLDQIQGSESVAQGILDGQASSGDGVVGIVVPREGVPMGDGEDGHLETDQGVLNGGGKIVDAVARHVIWDCAEPDEDREKEALPVGSKDDALDAQEFGHGAEWLQVVCHADPEHGQGVQTYGDADVVDDALPEVARANADVAFFVDARGLHDDASQCEQRLDPSVLKDAALHGEEGMRVGDVELGQHQAHGPRVGDGCSACHEDDEGALAADEVDEQLQEGVDGEGLVDVTERVDPGGSLDRHQTAPGGGGVDGHPEREVSRGSIGRGEGGPT